MNTPANHEAESRVLGAALLTNGRDVVIQLRDILSPEDFHMPRHQEVWTSMLALAEDGKPIDVVTLEDNLRRRGTLGIVGGLPELTKLTDNYATTVNVREHARIVHEESVRRKLVVTGRTIAEEAANAEDPVSYAVEAQGKIAKAGEGKRDDSLRHARDACTESFERIIRDVKSHGVVGLPTGLSCVDALTQGLVPKRYYIVAARPSMGKTALATGFAVHNAVWTRAEMLTEPARRRRLVPAIVFSMETDAGQLLERIAKGMAEIDLTRGRRVGELTRPEVDALARAYDQIHNSQLWIDDARNQPITALQSKTARIRADLTRGGYPPQDPILIVVDYIQLGRGRPGGDRQRTWEREVSEISGGLQALAGDANAAVVALSQLNRGVESRDDKRPRLFDLRDSGSLEQDANAVIFPYRPERYVSEDRDPAAFARVKGKAEIIIAKNRDGAIGTGHAEFIGKFTRFQNPQEGQTSVSF